MIKQIKSKVRKTFAVGLLLVLFRAEIKAQDFNKDFTKSFINHTTPKSPESTSIEKYGTVPVSESTGIPDISIPLYNINGNALSSAVTLTYHASGVKVNQEATWVGLGWDIRAGGRITLNIKGGYDRYTKQYVQPWVKSTLTYIFQHFSTSVNYNTVVNTHNPCSWTTPGAVENYLENGILPCDIPEVDSLFEATYYQDIQEIRKKGLAEPDIFTADFLGNSVTFYRDLWTDSIKIKGEKNLFRIEEIDLSTWSSRFVIVDESGVQYFFSQEEKTFYQPALEGVISSATTAWLLTEVRHPNGDNITYSYSNYGTIFTAPSISESESSEGGSYSSASNIHGSPFGGQEMFQEPQYLTKIRTKNTDVDFLLGSRKDVAGDGIRKVEMITVTNRVSNELLKQVKFNYDYFVGSGVGGYNYDTSYFHYGTPGPDNTALNHLTLRLKLLSVDIYGLDSNTAQTQKFYYKEFPVLPNKVSFSQDHWGYFNGENASITPGSVLFTPNVSSLLQEGVLPTQHERTYVTPTSTMDLSLALPGHVIRKANEEYALAAMLDSIIYPTGGSVKMEYELHKSNYSPKTNGPLMGGGVRVKSIKTYAGFGTDALRTKYEYTLEDGSTSGVYMGNLDYFQVIHKQVELYNTLGTAPGGTSSTENYYTEYHTNATLFSNGNLSADGSLVVYSRVVKKINEGTEGWIEKKFEVSPPYHSPHFVGEFPVSTHPYLPASPNPYVRGNLLSEKIFDKNDVLKKSVSYHYNGLTGSEILYSLKASTYFFPSTTYPFDRTGADIFYFHPMSTYKTLIDSTVEVNVENGINISTKIENRYNVYYQPEYVTTTSSKGEKFILYTKTPLSFDNLPLNETNVIRDALVIQSYKNNNMLNVPVEKLLISKASGQDSMLLRAAYNQYDVGGNLRKTYLVENAAPIPLDDFQKSEYNGALSGYNIIKDSRYQLNESVDYISSIWVTSGIEPYEYSPTSYIAQIDKRGQVTAVIWDTLQNAIIAQCENAKKEDVAYTSFEAGSEITWVVTGNSSIDATAPMGENVFDLAQSGAAITKTNLSATQVYTLTYWTKNASGYSITGTQVGYPVKKMSLNGWNYFEHRITGRTEISILGVGLIDELRLHPAESMMISFNYRPGVGVVSESDPSGRIKSYEYDQSNRLHLIRDQDKNVLKRIDYKYASQKVNFDGLKYLSNVQSKLFTRNNCGAGTPEQVLFIVPEGKYQSLVSQAEADMQAINDIDANGQAYANSTGRCQFYNQYAQAVFVQNNCAAGYMGATITYSVASNKYVSYINQADADQMAANEIAANGQALANQGTCALAITLDCPSGVPEPFSVTLHNTVTGVDYNFTISGSGSIGQVPVGTYDVRINPQSYSQPYTYILNGDYYSSGEISPVFSNISFTDPYNSTISIYW